MGHVQKLVQFLRQAQNFSFGTKICTVRNWTLAETGCHYGKGSEFNWKRWNCDKANNQVKPQLLQSKVYFVFRLVSLIMHKLWICFFFFLFLLTPISSSRSDSVTKFVCQLFTPPSFFIFLIPFWLKFSCSQKSKMLNKLMSTVYYSYVIW